MRQVEDDGACAVLPPAFRSRARTPQPLAPSLSSSPSLSLSLSLSLLLSSLSLSLSLSLSFGFFLFYKVAGPRYLGTLVRPRHNKAAIRKICKCVMYRTGTR